MKPATLRGTRIAGEISSAVSFGFGFFSCAIHYVPFGKAVLGGLVSMTLIGSVLWFMWHVLGIDQCYPKEKGGDTVQ